MNIITGAITLIIGLTFGYIMGANIDKSKDTTCKDCSDHTYELIYSRVAYTYNDLKGNCKHLLEDIYICSKCGDIKRVIKNVE